MQATKGLKLAPMRIAPANKLNDRIRLESRLQAALSFLIPIQGRVNAGLRTRYCLLKRWRLLFEVSYVASDAFTPLLIHAAQQRPDWIDTALAGTALGLEDQCDVRYAGPR